MRSYLLLPLAAGLLCACAERELKVGAYKSGAVVEADGASAVEARRAAVAGLLELFASSSTIAANRAVLDEKIFSRVSDFIPREKMIPLKGNSADTRLHILVSLDKLGRELDALGLVKPEGVAGKPLLLVRIIESGPGAGDHSASEAVRRALSGRGYAVVDLSSSTKDAANEEARKLKTGALIMGAVESFAMEDPKIEGYKPAAARLSLKAVAAPGPEALEEISADASSIDAALPAAGAKAMSAAGEIAAAKLRRVLGKRYRERTEMSAAFLGIQDVATANKLIADLRSQPWVVAAAFDSFVDLGWERGRELKVRVFVENPSADELASALMRLPGYAFNIGAVEADYHYVEMDASGRSWHAF